MAADGRERIAKLLWDTKEATEHEQAVKNMEPADRVQSWEEWKNGPDGVVFRAMADAVLPLLAERDRLLLQVRRDHMADNDCVKIPCAWCEALIAILPVAQMPPNETLDGR